MDATLRAYQQRFLAFADASRAVVAVVGGKRILEHLGGDAARRHGCRRRNHFENPDIAAEHIDIGNPGQAAQTRPYCPVDQAADFLHAERGGFHGEHQHLCQRRHDRRQPALGAVRQQVANFLQPLVDLRAGPVDVGALRKFEGDQSQ